MKKIFSILAILMFIGMRAQSPSLPITTVNNIKISNPVLGTKADSVLVWRGAGDKIARFLPISSVLDGAGYIKLNPSPDTEQTFIGDLRTRGAFESFSVSGSKTRLVSQGLGFIYNGSTFECLIGAASPFTDNRLIQIPDSDGVIALEGYVDAKTTLNAVLQSSANIDNTAVGTVSDGALLLLNSTEDGPHFSLFGDHSPGTVIAALGTELGGGFIKKGIQVYVDKSFLRGRFNVFDEPLTILDGVDPTDAASVGQLNEKANISGGNALIGDNTIDGKLGVGTTSPMSPFVISNGGVEGIEINPATKAIQSVNRSTGTFDILQIATTSLNFVYPGVDQIGTFQIGQSSLNSKLTIEPGTASTDAATLGQVQNMTGWAQYSGSNYTSGSPLVVNAGNTATLANNGSTSTITSQLPTGVTAFVNTANGKITPQNDGDFYIVNVRFKATSTSNTGAVDVGIDIGGAMGIVIQQTVPLIKGVGVEQRVSVSLPVFSGSTFVSNGGEVKVTSITGNTSIYDVTFVVDRTHKAK